MPDVEKDSSKTSPKDHVAVSALPVDSQRQGLHGDLASTRRADDALLAQLGYKSEFRREFSVRGSATSTIRRILMP